MRVLDPGHDYLLDTTDGTLAISLTFVKRDTPHEKYPGNHGRHPGVTIQEVLRVLIDRTQYLRDQACKLQDRTSDMDDERLLELFRTAIEVLESRTRRRRGQEQFPKGLIRIETYPACCECSHILCLEH